MFPTSFQPTDTLRIERDGRLFLLPMCRPMFRMYSEAHAIDTFGGKDLLHVDGKPQFAEVAILRVFESSGWQGRWLEPYQRGRMDPALLNAWNGNAFKHQIHLPIAESWVSERLNAIAIKNGNSYAGCWDVVVWKDGRLVFAEGKRNKKDRMRDTQLRWLQSALRCGCELEDFLVVEWIPDLRNTVVRGKSHPR